MSKRNRKIKRAETPTPSATEARAHQSVTPEQMDRGGYAVETFQDFDENGGLMDNHRLVRKAPVKGLERLSRPNGNTSQFLDDVEIQAANAYHADLLSAQGGADYSMRDQVDRSGNPQGTQLYLLDAQNKLAGISLRMDPALKYVIDEVFKHHDKTLSQIWSDETTRKARKHDLKDALYWLAGEYGLVSRMER